jgi:hypothetical protein
LHRIPHSKIEWLKSLAEDISIFSKDFLSILLLRLFSGGSETFMQILSLSGCGMARIELEWKFAKGGLSKGPATKPFFYPIGYGICNLDTMSESCFGIFYHTRAQRL